MDFAWTIVAMVVVLAIAWRFLGSYMAAVFEGRVRWLAFVERPIYRIIGVDPDAEQSWQRYSVSLIIYSAVALGVTYLIFRLQGVLPFNPQHLPAVTSALAWNTSVSFGHPRARRHRARPGAARHGRDGCRQADQDLERRTHRGAVRGRVGRPEGRRAGRRRRRLHD